MMKKIHGDEIISSLLLKKEIISSQRGNEPFISILLGLAQPCDLVRSRLTRPSPKYDMGRTECPKYDWPSIAGQIQCGNSVKLRAAASVSFLALRRP